MIAFFDLHAHLLPAIDDGPGTVEQAVELLRLAHATGTRGLVATPHMFAPSFDNRSSKEIEQAFSDYVGALRRLTEREPELAFLADLELYLGAENFCSPDFFAALDDGAVLSLNEGRHLLFELSPYLTFNAIEAAVRRILDAGYFPLLAHVERYPVLLEDPGRLAGLVHMGCRVQINADSVLGSRFSRARRRIFGLLASGRVTVIASDGHDTSSRPPRLDRVAQVLAAKFGSARTREWLRDNPRRLIEA